MAKEKKAATSAKARGLQSPAAQLVLGASAAVAGGMLAIIYALRRGRDESR